MKCVKNYNTCIWVIKYALNFWTKVAKPTLWSQQMQWLLGPFAFEMACFHI